MSKASTVFGLLGNATQKFRFQEPKSSPELTNIILSHLSSNGLQTAVSILFDSPYPLPPHLYAHLFQLCASQRAIVEARKVESHLANLDPNRNRNPKPKPPIFLLNRAIETYGKCGCLPDALSLFEEMHKRDGGSWNAVINACTQCGSPERALSLFKDMRRVGCSPNEITFAGVLGSCGDCLALHFAMGTHGLMMKCGFSGNVILETSLIDAYGKCNAMREARRMFDEIEFPNEVTWNVMLRRYLEVGDCGEAVGMFFRMLRTDVGPLSFTVSSAIVACSGLRAVREGMQIHGIATRRMFLDSEVVLSSLIDMYVKCGRLESARGVFNQPGPRDLISWTSMVSGYAMNGKTREARELFDDMPERNTFSWNGMLAGYTRSLQWEDALDFVVLMRSKIVDVDHVTITLLLNVCAGLSDVELGKRVHCFSYRHGLHSNVLVGNALLDMYGKCGNLRNARIWFSQMSELRDGISWNALLASYARHGMGEQAMTMFSEMQWETKPSKYTFATLLAACANTSALEMGKQVHGFMVRNNYNIDVVLTGALVNMYSKCNCVAYAMLLFRQAASRDLFLWNTIILGFSRSGKGKEVIQLFDFMLREEVRPDHVTMLGILEACIQEGDVELALRYFHSMSNDYCILPRVEHYECIIELLCQYGSMGQLEDFLDRLPFDPTVTMLTRVVNACRRNNFQRLGEWAASRLNEFNNS
ncbi:Pentatricopeptide repeat-containing protein At3g26540 [Linum grandiflorum]